MISVPRHPRDCWVAQQSIAALASLVVTYMTPKNLRSLRRSLLTLPLEVHVFILFSAFVWFPRDGVLLDVRSKQSRHLSTPHIEVQRSAL